MEEKKQKTDQIRKKEISDAVRKVFLGKGSAGAIMEDIITKTSLPEGGVYYHYRNKVEILHDLTRGGMAYRIEKINEFLSSYSEELDGNVVAQMIVDKMLDESELMSTYAIYLQSMENDEESRALFSILAEESLKASYSGVRGVRGGIYRYSRNGPLIFLIDMIVLGCEILGGTRDSFVRNREFFLNTAKLFIDDYDKGKIK